jgi:hypothetical protein
MPDEGGELNRAETGAVVVGFIGRHQGFKFVFRRDNAVGLVLLALVPFSGFFQPLLLPLLFFLAFAKCGA